MDLPTILTKIGNSKEAQVLKTQVMQAVQQQGWVAYRPPDDPNVKQVEELKNTVSDLLKPENSDYIDDVAWFMQISPWDTLTSGKQDFLGKIQYVLESKTLQNLIDAKAAGATFGALSEAELKMLQASAGSLASNAVRDKDTNKITWFDMSESELKEQLKKLNTLYSDKIDRMTWKWVTGQITPTQETPSQSGTAPATEKTQQTLDLLYSK